MSFAVFYLCVVIAYEAVLLFVLGDVLLSKTVRTRDVVPVIAGVAVLVSLVIGFHIVQAVFV